MPSTAGDFMSRTGDNAFGIGFVIFVFSWFSTPFRKIIDDNMMNVLIIGLAVCVIGAAIDTFLLK